MAVLVSWYSSVRRAANKDEELRATKVDYDNSINI